MLAQHFSTFVLELSLRRCFSWDRDSFHDDGGGVTESMFARRDRSSVLLVTADSMPGSSLEQHCIRMAGWGESVRNGKDDGELWRSCVSSRLRPY